MSPAIWLAMARDDLRAAELLQEHGLTPLSRMHADHAVDKALRALALHRERQEEKSATGTASMPAFPGASASCRSAADAERSRQRVAPALLSRSGEDSGWIAAALASLSLRAEHRRSVSDDADAELAREAVQVAHRVLDRITERVYGEL